MIGSSTAGLSIVGSGLYGPRSFSARAHAVLARADRIFFLTPELWLPKGKHSSQIVDLRDCYNGVVRNEAYEAMADLVVAAACVERTAFVTYGSPAIGSTVTYILQKRCANHGLGVELVDAESSFSAVCFHAGYDPFQGIQAVEASRYLRDSALFSTALPLILFQVAYLGIDTWPYERGRVLASHGLAALQRELEVVYGADHDLLVVEEGDSLRLESVPVCSLSKTHLTPASTLLVRETGLNASLLG